VVTSAVVMGISANIIASCLTGQAPIRYLPIPMITVILSTLWLARYFIGELVLESIPMVLLINSESGVVLPLGYLSAMCSSSALTRLKEIRPEALQVLSGRMPERNEPVLRDLIEYIVTSWLQLTSQSYMTPDGRVVFSPIPSPEPELKRFEKCEILEKFGENVFAEIPEDVFSEIVVPRSVTVIAKRHEAKGVEISVMVGERPLFRKVMGGEPGGSELILKGFRLSPLDFFAIRTFVERVSRG